MWFEPWPCAYKAPDLTIWATSRKFVGIGGFEPPTSCSQSRRDNRTTLYPGGRMDLKFPNFKFFTDWIYSTRYISTPGGNRTHIDGLENRCSVHWTTRAICGRRGNRTPKAFTPSCFQDSFLVHSDAFQLFNISKSKKKPRLLKVPVLNCIKIFFLNTGLIKSSYRRS